ncbi:hypothetical protein [Kitasatospora sp. NPDC057936]|uniref:hypothetical protein n=1 Tax=Kitasatospora sp. NPDC057936 TaxID=3346283 RepID=UPI0036D85144
MELVDIEIGRHDWDALHCGCGAPAGHLAGALARLARARSDEEARLDGIDGHAWIPSVVMEPSVPVVSVALAAITDDVSPAARRAFLEIVLNLVGDEGQWEGATAQGRSLPEECRQAARAGLWTLYAEVLSGRSLDSAAYAFEILDLIEEDEERLHRMQEAAGDRLPSDVRL